MTLAELSYKLCLLSNKNAPAGGETPREPAQQEVTVDTKNSTAPEPHPSPDEHPHACNDGWVTIGQLVVDPETGEETEEYALYLCRRCANAKANAK